MGLGGACCRAGAGGTLDRGNAEPPCLCETFEPRQNMPHRAHVAGLFLYPDNLSRVGMLRDGGGNFRARQRVELVEKENGGVGVLAAAALGAQLVADFSAGDQDATGGLHFAVGDQGQGARPRKFLAVLAGIRVAKPAPWGGDDKWRAP